VAMLSHDLRIPLSVLIGYSEMALESWSEMSETEKLEFVHKVSRAGDSLHTMLEETLAVSVLDAGGVEPRSVAVRVDSAVRELIGTLPQPLPEVDLALLEPATAYVDRGHLDQVLANLLTNAVKYGGGSFAVSCHEDLDSVYVRVADSGSGVAPEFVPELFGRFTRSEDARAGRQKGTGLGLYITEKLLVANAGSIHYLPTEGGGATFCLHLPRVARPVAPLPGADLPEVATSLG
jgi:signal transduction histidine kinase